MSRDDKSVVTNVAVFASAITILVLILTYFLYTN
jgi:hypothetical protein